MESMKIQPIVDAVMGRLFVELEASGRHVHVTAEQAKILFGHSLTEKRPLRRRAVIKDAAEGSTITVSIFLSPASRSRASQ